MTPQLGASHGLCGTRRLIPNLPKEHHMPTDPQTEADADTVASRAAQVISSMGADIRALTSDRDRYRAAWRSARERAQAYREGVLLHVAQRDFWQMAAEQNYKLCSGAEAQRDEARADRGAVLRWAADQIDAETRRLKADGVLEPDKFRPCRDASAQLRRLAAEAQQQPDTETPELPYTHTDDDAATLQIGAVMASTYHGQAPAVWLASEEHQGDDAACVYVRPERVEEVVTALRAAKRAAIALGPAVEEQPAAADTSEEPRP